MMLVVGTRLGAALKLTFFVPSFPMPMMRCMMALMSSALVPSCPLPWLMWQSEMTTPQNHASSTVGGAVCASAVVAVHSSAERNSSLIVSSIG